MIHLLEVGPEQDLKTLKKLSRKLAMTGGYELTLRADLTREEALELYRQHLPELTFYDRTGSTYFSNNSFRILALLRESRLLPDEQEAELAEILAPGFPLSRL